MSETKEPSLMTRDEVIAAAREVVRKEAVLDEMTAIVKSEIGACFYRDLQAIVKKRCGFDGFDLFLEARQIEGACVYIVAQLTDSNGVSMEISAAPGIVQSKPPVSAAAPQLVAQRDRVDNEGVL